MSTPDRETSEERSPPHDLHQEAALISTVLGDETNKTYHCVAHLLSPDDFYSPAHRRIWSAIVAVASDGPIDAVKVAHHLQVEGRLAEVGGIPALTRLTDYVASIADIEGHAANIRELSRVRATITTCQRVAADGYAPRIDHADWLQNAAMLVAKASETPPKSSLEPVRSTMTRFFDLQRQMDEARREGREVGGLSSGYTEIDRVMGRMRDGELIVLAARPGMGKTSFAMALARNITGHIDPVELSGAVVFSLEMPSIDLIGRMLASESKQNVKKVLAGEADLTALDKAAQAVCVPHLMTDDVSTKLVDIKAVARRAKTQMSAMKGPHGQAVRLRFIVIDYLQLVKVPPKKNGTRDQELGEVTRELKELGKELGAVVIALSQLNRELEKRPDKRPKLSDLRESGSIEQDADRVVFIYREEYYNPRTEDRNVAEFIAAKHRNGASNKTVALTFIGEHVGFYNLEPSMFDSASRVERDETQAPSPRGNRGASSRRRRSSEASDPPSQHWQDSNEP